MQLAEVNRLKAVCEAKGSDVIIGLGGGKSLDTAKAVAHLTNKPVIIVPTIASTDGAMQRAGRDLHRKR